jgi:TRAP-type C4-dicarboxylate transport system substrate-binding protein
MNKDKWNQIGPEDQDAIEKINQAYIEKQANLWVTLDNAAKDFAISKGVKFLQPSTADYNMTLAAMKPILDKYVAMAKGKGLPGDEALKFCQDYLKSH